MYHSGYSGLNADSGRFPRSPSSFAAGRSSGGASASIGEELTDSFVVTNASRGKHVGKQSDNLKL